MSMNSPRATEDEKEKLRELPRKNMRLSHKYATMQDPEFFSIPRSGSDWKVSKSWDKVYGPLYSLSVCEHHEGSA
jgi:hypothetical protein